MVYIFFVLGSELQNTIEMWKKILEKGQIGSIFHGHFKLELDQTQHE